MLRFTRPNFVPALWMRWMTKEWNRIYSLFSKYLEEKKLMNVGGIHNPQAGLVRHLVRKNLITVFKIGCLTMRFILDSTIKSSRQPSIVLNGLLSTSPKMGITCAPMIRSILTTFVTVVNSRMVSLFFLKRWPF